MSADQSADAPRASNGRKCSKYSFLQRQDRAVDVLALVISALSLLVAGVGTYQANKRANEALAESRKAAEDAR
ncbi:hypothetical protein [Changpingibacter yushuensis]|uniref:hypothetical protein n=1 Tax=Changpingibacter yushuensis TaxID=2758440 RepID=UPI001CB6FFEA|nr:hypothetical protein [Changpingibacter yushuensis]